MNKLKPNLDKTDMLLVSWKADQGTGIHPVLNGVTLPLKTQVHGLGCRRHKQLFYILKHGKYNVGINISTYLPKLLKIGCVWVIFLVSFLLCRLHNRGEMVILRWGPCRESCLSHIDFIGSVLCMARSRSNALMGTEMESMWSSRCCWTLLSLRQHGQWSGMMEDVVQN